MKFRIIIESPKVLEYLEKHFLLEQYKKAKYNILSGNDTKVFLKPRKPKGSGIWYFRINKKYRALGYIKDNELRIYNISDHQ